MKKIFSFILIAVFIFGAAAPVFAASTTTAKFENLFYYVPGFTSYYSFEANAAKVGIFAPQAFNFDGNGNVTGSISDTTNQVIAANKTKVMPLVANNDFDSSIIESVLHSQSAQNLLIGQLVSLAQKNNYIGWQLDIEHVPAIDRDLFSTFVESASKQFHANNLKISIAVVSRTSDLSSDLPAGSWDAWAGVYDYARIAKAVDFVSVMAYDMPATIGPVDSLLWIKKVITYSLKYIPKSKLSLGIATYGYQWNLDTNKRIAVVTNHMVSNLIESKQYIAKGYDKTVGESWITFNKVSNGTTIHEKIWYENAQSFAPKLALAKYYGLRGISVWAIGTEDAGIWKLVK